MKQFTFLAAVSLGLLPTAALTQTTVLSGDHSITGNVCVGSSQCTSSENFGNSDFKVKSSFPVLLLEDSSTTGTMRDWSLQGNDGANEFFRIRDVETARDVFFVEAGARDHALYLDDSGHVGLGTALPQEELHFVDVSPTLRMEAVGTSPQIWDINANAIGVSFTDVTDNTLPFLVSSGAPDGTFRVTQTGNVGLGTISPDAPLELSRSDSFNFFRITAEGAAVNDSVDITFTEGPLGTGQLRYNIVDGDNQEMSLDADGNMVLDGTLTTAGPRCAAGCDRVFDPGYALTPIEDRAAQMYSAGHLPAIGPTQPGAPLNVTEKLAGVINELEHAHIYIDQLHRQMSAMQTDHAAVLARLDALERQ